ncbi:hypothetical protein OB955_11385 [Halobacteria archaeon AArc-m2/3/4]|uniref:Uncharacterized protein n=1 Tax=Natronoglomus mannanivorans TaxID=2979990 RepID=A0ABT2QEJ4_9EURY|nr:hypothetical protein [Halobacteria archaeon AArc-m2/3/4]
MRRRSLLIAAGGLTGFGGLVGVHQRRRLSRWADRDALRSTLEVDVPDPAGAVVVTESHLESAHADLETLVDEARNARSAHDEPPATTLSRAVDTLEETDPDAVESDSNRERERLLDRLRRGLVEAGRALATIEADRGELVVDEVREEVDALESRADGTEIAYRADSVSESVVQYAAADEALEDARTRIDWASERLEGYPSSSVGYLAHARGSLADAERFAAVVDGEELDDRFEERYRALTDATETILEATEFEYDDDRLTYAFQARSFSQPRTDGAGAASVGDRALAVRAATEEYARANTLEAFTDVPATGYGHPSSDLASAFDTTGEDALAAKERAADAVGKRLEADGDKPLARHLLAGIRDRIDTGDRRVESTFGEINEASDDEWIVALADAALLYRQAALEAERLPAGLELVAGRR